MSPYFYSLGYLFSQPIWVTHILGDISSWSSCLPDLEALSNEENQ